MTDRRIREAIRYLGYGKHAVDMRTGQLIEEAFIELDSAISVKWVYRIFAYEEIEKREIKSKNLLKNLKDCREIIVLAVTLGAEVDRLLRRYSITDISRAAVLQACAAAYLEEFCDKLQGQIETELEGKSLRPRFSPGYGDFDIKHQKDLLLMLDASKKIGIGYTDSYMLTPTKSVTAIIGVSETNENCHKYGCEVCEKSDCAYRRN